MSYCPRPSTVVSQAYPTPGTKTVTGGTAKFEPCAATGTSTVVTDPGTPDESTSTTVYVPGPPGKDGLGFIYEGEWATTTEYKVQDEVSTTERLSSVVTHHGQTYICIQAHTADGTNEPQLDTFVGPSDWASYWELISVKGSTGDALPPEEKSFFENLKDGIFDWVKNASIGDLLLAGAAAVGVIWAGSKILDMISGDGDGDGAADQRFQNGSPGYVSTGFVAPDIKDVLNELCTFGMIPHDTSALPDAECQFVLAQSVQLRVMFSQLALAYQFDMVDSAGVLKFVPRSATSVKTLTFDDLGFTKGAEGGTEPRYTTKRFQGIDLPRSVTLTYFAEDADYNQYTQTSWLPTYDNEGQDVQLSVPITITHEKAKQITEISLIQAHVERMQHKVKVTLKHLDLECGDVITCPEPIGAVRINKINELDSEGLIELECTDAGVEAAIETSDLEDSIPPASINVPLVIGYSQAFWVDPNNLSETDTGTRMYCAVHGYDKAGWPGAQIFMSENNGASYESIGLATKEATVGLVALATESADYHGWDNVSTISVQLKTNELASVAEIDVLNGKNWAMIGQEIIGFKNAVLTGPKTYTLSGLLRGRQGTEVFVGTHVTNELFCLIDDALVRIDLENADRTTTKKFKVVTVGSSPDVVDAEDVYITSNNLRPWAPYGAKVLLTGTDWVFTFKERVRYNNVLRDEAEIAHDADWAGFGIIIYDADGVTVKNKYITQLETWTYTSAMQLTDFGAPQASIKSAIVQLSQLGASGYPVSLNS